MGINFLIIDDHPMIIEGYLAILKKIFPSAMYHRASNIQTAIEISEKLPYVDYILVDYNLQDQNEQHKIYNGIDLTNWLRGRFSTAKFFIITAHEEVAIIYNIHKKADPHALLIKSDLSGGSFKEAFKEIENGMLYRTPKAAHALILSNQKDVLLQDKDNNLQIIMLLNQGYQIQELPDLLHKSLSTIQRSVAALKKAFNVTDNGRLLLEAKNQGFI